MPITECVVHELSRANSETPIKLSCPDESLSITGGLQELVGELKQAYVGKAGKQYGAFDQDLSVSVVSQWLRECLEQKMAFTSFAKRASEHFKSLLENSDVVMDGHLLYVIEELADGLVFSVFFVRHNEGYFINHDLGLDISRFLDVKGVMLGGRVAVSEWQSEQGGSGYLSVLRARGDKDFTDLFWQWLGFSDQRDIAAETNQFLQAVTQYSETLDEDAGQQCRHAVIDYCLEQDKRGEPVVIRDLSRQLNEDQPEKFERFIASETPEPVVDLIPERRQIKQFLRISGRNDRLSMSFDVECLGDSIVYDQGSDSLTVKNLPAPLKLKLMKYLQKGHADD
ncbi:MAG: hypothetical protein AseanaTS_18180 [Candidatus Pelagadaptatus aseana]|uniref:nucleoid-associated protein n=1 Tax=Candidatus Pelagadaptatus aseana TaxID=3120508 RepID=UPI0039B18B6E